MSGVNPLAASWTLPPVDLVTNAVLHTRGPVQLTVRQQSTGLLIEVCDGDPDAGGPRIEHLESYHPRRVAAPASAEGSAAAWANATSASTS